MSNTKTLIEAVEAASSDAEAMRAKVGEAETKRREELRKLSEHIRSGGTTGDRVKDYLIATQGSFAPECEAVYRSLVERVGRCQGEFVLVIERRERFHGCAGIGGGSPRPEQMHMDTSYFLGILNGELRLEISDGGWNFPTGTHVCHTDSGWRSEPSLEDGDLWFSKYRFVEIMLNELLECKNPIARMEDLLKLEIHIGNAEIGEWLGQPANINELVASDLKKRREMDVPGWRQRRNIETFMKLLGAGNWETPDSLTVLNEYLYEQRVEAQDDMKAAVARRQELLERIEETPKGHGHTVIRLHEKLHKNRSKLVASLERLRLLHVDSAPIRKLRAQFGLDKKENGR